MMPPMSTLSPVPTFMRVEMLPSSVGVGGVGWGIDRIARDGAIADGRSAGPAAAAIGEAVGGVGAVCEDEGVLHNGAIANVKSAAACVAGGVCARLRGRHVI